MNDDTDYITINIDKWSDEEVLTNFFKFFPRVAQTTELIENEDGVVVAQVLVTISGNKIVFSEPETLEWPLVKLESPEDEIVATFH